MAEGKKSFVLYSDIIHMVRKMPVEKQGELFMLILSFVNDENPQTDDLLLQIAFEPIKVNLKRDLKQWEVFSKNKSESGFIGNIKRWHEDVYNDFVNEKITIDEAKEIVKNRKSSVSDETDSNQSQSVASVASNVSVSANVNANVNANVTNPLNKGVSGNKKHLLKALESSSWIELVAMQSKLKPEVVTSKLNEFYLLIEAKTDVKTNYKDFVSHFVSWVNSKENEKKPTAVFNSPI